MLLGGGGEDFDEKRNLSCRGRPGDGDLSSHRIWCHFLKRKDIFLFQKSNLSLLRKGEAVSQGLPCGGKAYSLLSFLKEKTSRMRKHSLFSV